MKETKNLKKRNHASHIPPHTSERAITLIALVITIIVMLILVAVTITVAINGGLFDYAGKAASKTGEARDAEQNLANGRVQVGDTWYNNIDDYLNNIPSENQQEPKGELPEGIKAGDYVNYTPTPGKYPISDEITGITEYNEWAKENSETEISTTGKQEFTTQTDLQWRVWSIDKVKGTVEIVAATGTSDTITLAGANGYNHAVDILNDMCKALYSNGNASARSINVEDINSKTTFKPETYTKYGQTFTQTSGLYPNIYADELGGPKGGWYYGGENLLTGSQGVRKENGEADYEKYKGSCTSNSQFYTTFTDYAYTPEECLDETLGENKAVSGLIYTGTDYWLASRCVNCSLNYVCFLVRRLRSNGELTEHFLCDSLGNLDSCSLVVRPIVSLPSSVTWTAGDPQEDGTPTWNINL